MKGDQKFEENTKETAINENEKAVRRRPKIFVAEFVKGGQKEFGIN